MEYLTKVQASALKGRSFNHTLTPKVMIFGPNWTGKTAVLDAIGLALSGFKPVLGEKNSATFKLSSADEMKVAVATSAGRVVKRTWTRKGDGVAQQKSIPDGFAPGSALLNPREYFTLSQREQIETVFRLAPPAQGYTDQSALDAVEKLRMGDDVTTEAEEGIDMVLGWVREALGTDLRQALLSLTEDKGKLATEYTKWNRSQRQSGAGTAKLFSMGAAGAISLKPEDVERKIEERNKELLTIQGELGGLLEQIQAAAKHGNRRWEIEQALAQPVADYDAEVKEWEERIAGLRALVVPVQDADLAAAKTRVAEAKARVEKWRDFMQSQNLRLAQLSELGICKKCAAKLIDPIKTELADADKTHSEATEEWVQATAALNQASALEAENAKLIRANQAYSDEIAEYQGNIEDCHKAKADDAAELVRLQEELGRMGPAPATNEARAAELRSRADTIRIWMEPLRKELRDANAVAEQRRAEDQARADHRREQEIAAVVKAARESLLQLQGEMVAAVFGSLLTTANAIAGDLLSTPLAYFQGSVGRMENGGFVSYDTFTESEQALAAISISAALGTHAPVRVLMLDEMGTMTPALQGAVLKRLSGCVDAGMLDQIICVMPRETPPNVPGDWTVIGTGKAVVK